MEHFFSPNSSTDLRSDARQSQIIAGDAAKDHTQIAGGYTFKLLGGIYPPSPPGFGTPVFNKISTVQKIVLSSSRGFGLNLTSGLIFVLALCFRLLGAIKHN